MQHPMRAVMRASSPLPFIRPRVGFNLRRPTNLLPTRAHDSRTTGLHTSTALSIRVPGRGGPARSTFYARSPLAALSRAPPAVPGGNVWVRVPLTDRDKELARISAHLPVEELALPCGATCPPSSPVSPSNGASSTKAFTTPTASSPPRLTTGPSADGAPLGAVRQVPFAHIPHTQYPRPNEFGYGLPPIARPVSLALFAAFAAVALAAYTSVHSSASLARAVREQERENSPTNKILSLLRGLGDLTSFTPSTSVPDDPVADVDYRLDARPSSSYRRDGDAWATEPMDDPFLGVGEARLRSAQTHRVAASLGTGLQHLISIGKELHFPTRGMESIVQSYLNVAEYYLSLSPGHAAMIAPLALATLAQIPFKVGPVRFRLWLLDRMAHAPGARTKAWTPRPPGYWVWMREAAYEASQKVPRLHTVLTSGWTHISTLHLVANGVAIYSIGSVAIDRSLRPSGSLMNDWGASSTIEESSNPLWSAGPRGARDPHLTSAHVPEASLVPIACAILFAGAAVGGATSHVVGALRARYTLTRLLRQWSFSRPIKGDRNKVTQELMQRYSSTLTRHSLGLSGGAYSLVMLLAMEMPDAQVVGPLTLFVPQSIATSTSVLLLLDLTGLVLGWKTFDHAAHLGGAAFGWLWFMYGQESYERLKAFWARRLTQRQQAVAASSVAAYSASA